MPEAIASQLSAGAGRLQDLRWPSDVQFRPNGTNVPTTILQRSGQVDAQIAGLSLNANANIGWFADHLGRSGATVGATVAGSPNGAQWSFQPMMVHVGRRGTGTAPPSMAGLDQRGAYRVMMIAWFSTGGPTPANVDLGLELCCCGGGGIDDGQIMRLGTPGLGFRCNDVGAIEAIIRPTQAGAVQRVDLTPANYFQADWHCYELRVIGAQGTQEAIAKWFIDGQLRFSQSWGPGNVMPETNGNQSGFRTNVVSNGGNAFAVVVDQLCYHSSKDELNLL